jgi:hypothetical protein
VWQDDDPRRVALVGGVAFVTPQASVVFEYVADEGGCSTRLFET